MSIRPVDLQNMIARLDEAGREENANRATSAANKSLQGKKLAEQELRQDQEVNQSEEDKESRSIGEKDGQRNPPHQSNPGTGGQEESEPARELIQDEKKGKIVDLQG